MQTNTLPYTKESKTNEWRLQKDPFFISPAIHDTVIIFITKSLIVSRKKRKREREKVGSTKFSKEEKLLPHSNKLDIHHELEKHWIYSFYPTFFFCTSVNKNNFFFTAPARSFPLTREFTFRFVCAVVFGDPRAVVKLTGFYGILSLHFIIK